MTQIHQWIEEEALDRAGFYTALEEEPLSVSPGKSKSKRISSWFYHARKGRYSSKTQETHGGIFSRAGGDLDGCHTRDFRADSSLGKEDGGAASASADSPSASATAKTPTITFVGAR